MVKHASVKDFLREIKKTISRFISIILLLILSVSFFAGLRVTKPDMRLTADSYMDASHMYDIRVQSTLGLTDEDIDAIGKLDGVSHAEGFYQFDAIAAAPEQDIVVSVLTLSNSDTNPPHMNLPEVLSGRLPVRLDECVVEERVLNLMKLKIGDTFYIQEVSKAFENALENKAFTIVGVVRSPSYISRVQRGSSALGSGSVSAFIMIPNQAVNLDYYTEADITVTGALAEIAYTDTYKAAVQVASDKLKELEKIRAPLRYQEVVSEATAELQKSKTELNDRKKELEDSISQLNEAKAELADGQKQLLDEQSNAESEFQKAWEKLLRSDWNIQNGYKELETAQKELDNQKAASESRLDAARVDLDGKQAQLDAALSAYNDARTALDRRLNEWNALPDNVRQTMPDKAAELQAAEQQLETQKQQLDAQQDALYAGYTELDNQKAALEQQISDARQQLDDGLSVLKQSERQLKAGFQDYAEQKAETDKKFTEAEAELNDAQIKIADSEVKIKEGREKIAEGEAEIRGAEAKIDAIEECQWYVSDRMSNVGYDNYGQDADRMGALGNVFPAIFFAVAALVCLTTMTRMVDEKRTEIGTYKALGHGRLTTAGKFVFYSLSATVIGVAGGLLLGTLVLPKLIFKAYSMLYNLPPLETPLQLETCLISAAIAFVCTVGATGFACAETLRETPASLLRPKAPEPGKRVLMEYITPLWKRMSFFAKVSMRNIFRYKKRLIMTLLGIAGCTALIVTGFGLRDSITDIAGKQFGKILKYDLQVYLTQDATEEKVSDALSNIKGVQASMLAQNTAADFEASAATESGRLVILRQPDGIGEFIELSRRTDGKKIQLTDSGAVITEKLAERLGLRIGDTFTVDADGKHTLKVQDITENYVYHYVYMTPQYYKTVFHKDIKVNQLLIKLTDAQDETANAVSSELLRISDVGNVSHFRTIAKSFGDSMNSINYVMIIILVSAALLALVVLYNLTNINITERSRELATIKVLGFFDREVSWYIFRENTILTAVGILVGLAAGKFLHAWLVRTVELNFLMFGREAKAMSYLYAALLTFIFAIFVNVIGHRHMKRINMIESLKTNE